MKKVIRTVGTALTICIVTLPSFAADGVFSCRKNGANSGEWVAADAPRGDSVIPIDFCGKRYYISEYVRVNLLDRYCLGGNGHIRNRVSNEIDCQW